MPKVVATMSMWPDGFVADPADGVDTIATGEGLRSAGGEGAAEG
ncbi:hypothetical protein [Kribbella sancticallisti]